MKLFFDLFESLFDYTQGFYDFVDLVNVYDPIGIVMVAVVLIVWLLYYVVINHARLNRWYWWLLFALVACGICFGAAWGITSNNVYHYYADESMEIPNMGNSFLLLSTTVSIYAFVFFLILSAIFKRFCHNCRHTPWKSVWPKH